MSSDDEKPNRLKQYAADRSIPASLEKASNFLRDKLVSLRPKERPVYYHRKFARVPTIDECELEDKICKYEANEQLARDRKVDLAKLRILRKRLTECNVYWGQSFREKCEGEKKDFEENQIRWFIKYGELSKLANAEEYYMKQKHRMIWLRRRLEAGDVNASYLD